MHWVSCPLRNDRALPPRLLSTEVQAMVDGAFGAQRSAVGRSEPHRSSHRYVRDALVGGVAPSVVSPGGSALAGGDLSGSHTPSGLTQASEC